MRKAAPAAVGICDALHLCQLGILGALMEVYTHCGGLGFWPHTLSEDPSAKRVAAARFAPAVSCVPCARASSWWQPRIRLSEANVTNVPLRFAWEKDKKRSTPRCFDSARQGANELAC